MLLLITGASGVGKTTVRLRIRAELPPAVEDAELSTLVPIPAVPTLAWRQEVVETAVQRAVLLQAEGKHLLLAGDPIPPGEVVAAPSFGHLEGFAACLLDLQPHAHRQRLAQRRDPVELWPLHLAFAEWMRHHLHDPQHLPAAIQQGGWEQMQWQRWATWQAGDPRWNFSSIETTDLGPEEIARAVLTWCRAVLPG
ncbi:hypothetical protein MF271_03810 [Deinococcus sp. KNUC1210]|uniref:hypothetical protein n=1 Tax=Deinococcus sp. KNUC1210 TaxID=2917691 RepID=UPI001EF06974|nr:hypothetical protein [Deinococcus sp. KNUC1210]ULH15773.1 hypothetical protein MF271_03810 [Deinococcus sp. KNUC1210]